MLNNGFPGEGIRNGSVIVVKTHSGNGGGFPRNIVVVRHPTKAIAAGISRQISNSHIEGTCDPKKIEQKVRQKFQSTLHGWTNLYNALMKLRRKPLLLVSYSRLKSNTSGVLEEILDFLNIKKSER